MYLVLIVVYIGLMQRADRTLRRAYDDHAGTRRPRERWALIHADARLIRAYAPYTLGFLGSCC